MFIFLFYMTWFCQNWSKEVFVITKFKNSFTWTYVISDLKGEEIVGTLYGKVLQKTNQKEFRVEKLIKRKDDRIHMLNGKATIVVFNSWIDKKYIIEMSEYFLKPKSFRANMKLQLDLSNYATNIDFKNAAGVDTSDFAKKTDLTSLKSDMDKLDIDKLENLPSNLNSLKCIVGKLHVDKLVPFSVDLYELSDIAKNDVVKKTEYNELVEKLIILILL